VLAVGRQAQQALKWLDIPALAVRHPAHGGATEFQTAIRQLMVGEMTFRQSGSP
jgi:hypothetical protein